MKIYCFDFDGTIADTIPAMTRVLNLLLKEVGEEERGEEIISRIKNEGIKKVIKSMKISPLKMFFILRRARAEMNKEIKNIEAKEGIKETLEALSQKGFVLGILTSNSKKNVVDFLKKSDLPLFDFILTTSMFGKKRKLEKLKKKGDLVYIGDETRDVEAGNEAGVLTIGVTWGLSSEKELVSVHPNLIAREPRDILDL